MSTGERGCLQISVTDSLHHTAKQSHNTKKLRVARQPNQLGDQLDVSKRHLKTNKQIVALFFSLNLPVSTISCLTCLSELRLAVVVAVTFYTANQQLTVAVISSK